MKLRSRSRSLCCQALALDPELSAAAFSTGSVAWTRGDLQTAARHFRQAAELEVNGDALAFLSYVYALADRIPSASGWAASGRGRSVECVGPMGSRDRGYSVATSRQRVTGSVEASVVPGDPVLSLLLPVALVYAAVRSDDPQLQGGEREEARIDSRA